MRVQRLLPAPVTSNTCPANRVDFTADFRTASICLMSYIRYDLGPGFRSDLQPAPPHPYHVVTITFCNDRPQSRTPSCGLAGRRSAGVQPAVPADQGPDPAKPAGRRVEAGEAIPSEMELAARFSVSQGTVRKAIDELAAENLRHSPPGQRHLRRHPCRAAVQYRFLKLMPTR